jgi:hypothetical protein
LNASHRASELGDDEDLQAPAYEVVMSETSGHNLILFGAPFRLPITAVQDLAVEMRDRQTCEMQLMLAAAAESAEAGRV